MGTSGTVGIMDSYKHTLDSTLCSERGPSQLSKLTRPTCCKHASRFWLGFWLLVSWFKFFVRTCLSLTFAPCLRFLVGSSAHLFWWPLLSQTLLSGGLGRDADLLWVVASGTGFDVGRHWRYRLRHKRRQSGFVHLVGPSGISQGALKTCNYLVLTRTAS